MGSEPTDIKSIFVEALEMATDERPNFLDRVCGNNDSLRRKVEEFLRLHEDVGDFLESPPLIDQPPLLKLPEEKLGTSIDKYKLLEKIGEGGMAVVYMAEQTEPIRRKVALKIIKLGMDTKSVIARFEAERQALAIMDHPNIAKVLDAGATETGRPYFVMELVTGVSITEYCDKNNLSTKERLALFIQVCNAVQHAHQKGIIHRDIKPTNVMVTRRNGEPIPKVIDFGIAKATSRQLTEKTLFTRYAHIIGTPAYMSPEQAELSELDIDTRTDIYSLGVLLYELLTGTTPFSEEELRKAGYVEMQRIIHEEEPTKPSTKLSTLGETITNVAKHRSSTPDLLRKAIRGDLDWIVMKTLEKDRVRRYETANGLAMDIQRHLDSEPVLARGPSAAYRLQKFLYRNRVPAVAVLAIGVVIIVMGVVLSMWNRDRLQLAEAEALKHSSILSQARDHVAKADYAAALESVKSILRSKHVGPEAQLLYAGILVEGRHVDDAVPMLEDLLGDRPEIAGAAHALLARILWGSPLTGAEKLKKVDEHRRRAEELLQKTAEAYFLRAMTALTIEEKLEMLDVALDIDPAHYESRRLRAYTYLCSRNFSSAAEDGLCLVMLRPQDPLGHTVRAHTLRELGRCEEAINSYNKAIDYTSSEDPQLVELYDHRRQTYIQMGSFQEALLDAKKCVSLADEKEIYHIHVFTALVSLGLYEEAKAKYSELYDSLPLPNTDFWLWCAKYVIDTLESGHELQLPGPLEAAFLPMLEARTMYENLTTKGRRVITDGFHANWSPDGTKLAYSKGVHGVSGVVVYDMESQESELLAVPGKDPLYSPDGRYIAFIRDRQVLPLDRLATDEQRDVQPEEQEEIWIMTGDGAEPRRIVRGKWPHWSPDSECLFYTTVPDNTVYSIAIAQADATPIVVFSSPGGLPRLSRDSRYVAYMAGGTLNVFDLSLQAPIAQWVSPLPMDVVCWAPNSPQLRIYHTVHGVTGASLWMYDLKQNDVAKVLTAPRVGRASWSLDGTQLALAMGAPLYDIWILDAEALGPGQTLEQHLRERAEFYDRLVQADPCTADRHLFYAAYHQYLADPNSSFHDLKRYAELFFGKPNDYGTPVNLGPIVNSAGVDRHPSISSNGLELFFTSNRFDTLGDHDIWVSRRESTNGQWDKPTNLGQPVNSSALEETPCISQDGLTLYFASNRQDGHGDLDLWVTRRETIDDEWGPCTNLGQPVNSSAVEAHPHISTDGLSLYFSGPGAKGRSEGCGYNDIWVAKRASINDGWNAPVNLGPQINSSSWDGGPCVSSDGLYLFFHSFRSGNHEIWVSQRKNTSEAFEKPRLVAPSLLSPFQDCSVSVSADNRTLYFASERPGGSGGSDLWQAPVLHWPDDIEAFGGTDPPEMLPQSDEGKDVVPDAKH